MFLLPSNPSCRKPLQTPKILKKKKPKKPVKRSSAPKATLNIHYRTDGLWFFKNDKIKTWQANLRLISRFDTVEDFWASTHRERQKQEARKGGEDEGWRKGSLLTPLAPRRFALPSLYNHIELSSNLMSGCDYSLFKAFRDYHYSDEVCGVVINFRMKGDKIAVWTTEYENRVAVTHIGKVYKERLGGPQKLTIGYQSHADTATKSGSTTKNKFIV
ncbi:hypothetical protein COCON_G00104470 [Conger conger]|uniref:Uncharacterized protein n=1 Tax=Conger conger TaxID=82655 RepID=A0A9Q1HYU2_CONCO|nr:hypothetical protein COCON_G00104470 [Conger conger]